MIPSNQIKSEYIKDFSVYDENLTNVQNELQKLSKIKQSLNAQSWTDDIESLFRSWSERAKKQYEMHALAALNWKKYSLYISVPLLAFLGLSSIIGVIYIIDLYQDIIFIYVLNSCTLFSFIVSVLSAYYKPDKKQEIHIHVAKAFESFYKTIDIELEINRDNRIHSDEFQKWMKEQLKELEKNQPPLPKKIRDKYMDNWTMIEHIV